MEKKREVSEALDPVSQRFPRHLTQKLHSYPSLNDTSTSWQPHGPLQLLSLFANLTSHCSCKSTDLRAQLSQEQP